MKDPIYTDVGGIRTRYFEKGAGEPLVLIHGGQYGSYYSANGWSLNFDELAQHFHVFAFDKLGMGHTDNPPSDSEYTIGATVEHAFRFISKMGLEKVNLVGHSRGALVIARLAIEHSSLVSTLCVVDSNTLAPDDPSTPEDFYTKIEAKAPKIQTRESIQAEALANSYSTSHITDDFVDQMFEISKTSKFAETRTKMKVLRQSLFIPDIDRKRLETIKEIKKGGIKQPTLICWGYNDPSAPVKLAYNLFGIFATQVPSCQLHIFNRSGHYSFREHPKDFDRMLTTFIGLSRS